MNRHATDFSEAKDEARRAIVAKLEGRDPKGLVPSDDPTLAQLLEEYVTERPQRSIWQWKAICRHVIGTRPLGESRLAAQLTATKDPSWRRLRRDYDAAHG